MQDVTDHFKGSQISPSWTTAALGRVAVGSVPAAALAGQENTFVPLGQILHTNNSPEHQI